MKLLLGCGGQKLDGYMGVDIESSVNPDIIDNIITLSTIKDQSVDKIKSIHSFEHLTYSDAMIALKNWYRILKYEGELSIEFPDLYQCKLMIESNNSEKRQFGINGLFGDINSKNFNLIHKFAWSFTSLSYRLDKLGFENIRKAEPERINQCKLAGYDRDIRLIANKEREK